MTNKKNGDNFRVEVRPLTDAVPDPNNINDHTERGLAMLNRSIRERGIFRPIAAAGKGLKNPVIMAGSATEQTLVDLGLDSRAVFVYTNGDIPIVHVREDLDPESAEAQKLALEDNRVAEVDLNLNERLLGELAKGQPEIIEGLYSPLEISQLLAGLEVDDIPDGETGTQDTAELLRLGVSAPAEIGAAIIAFLDNLKPRGVRWTRK